MSASATVGTVCRCREPATTRERPLTCVPRVCLQPRSREGRSASVAEAPSQAAHAGGGRGGAADRVSEGRCAVSIVSICLPPGFGCGAAHVGDGAVRDGSGYDGDEHGDRDGRRRRRDRRDRDPDGDHAIHAGDGVFDDHRREGRRDHRPEACVHDRVRRLRVRVADDGAVSQPAGADHRLVVPRGFRRRVDHAGDRGAGRLELRTVGPAACVRARGGRGRDRGCGRAGDRRLVHDLCLVAVGVRRRGADRDRDPRSSAAGERHTGREGRQARPGRHRRCRRPASVWS